MERRNAVNDRPKKALGQNFLTDAAYASKIVEALDIGPADTVVEIGPGRGALTSMLLDAGRVFAIELDRDLIPQLQSRFANEPKLTIIEDDALEVDFRRPPFSPSAPMKLVANLPYYISTAILQRLAEQRSAFAVMVLMFQREVVERITAEPGNSERGFLSVLIQEYFHVEKLFDVPPDAFSPRPKIWSSVARFRPRADGYAEIAKFRMLASLAFRQKRKTIQNNLKLAFADASAALDAVGIEPGRRAETLTRDEWRRLTDALLALHRDI